MICCILQLHALSRAVLSAASLAVLSGALCSYDCHQCQGMKLVKGTQLTKMWKYRTKQRAKVSK